MIDLTNFSDLVPKSGRYSVDTTYIRITESQCKLTLGKDAHATVTKFLGPTVNAKVSPDLSVLVLTRGQDRRVNSADRSISLISLKERLREKYGASIGCIYFDCRWDEDESGRKVYVLKDNGRKEYNAEPTVRKLKG